MVSSALRTPSLAASAVFTVLLFISERGLAQDTEIESLRSLVKGMEQQLQKALQQNRPAGKRARHHGHAGGSSREVSQSGAERAVGA